MPIFSRWEILEVLCETGSSCTSHPSVPFLSSTWLSTMITSGDPEQVPEWSALIAPQSEFGKRMRVYPNSGKECLSVQTSFLQSDVAITTHSSSSISSLEPRCTMGLSFACSPLLILYNMAKRLTKVLALAECGIQPSPQ